MPAMLFSMIHRETLVKIKPYCKEVKPQNDSIPRSSKPQPVYIISVSTLIPSELEI
jgi:hypothetical protein